MNKNWNIFKLHVAFCRIFYFLFYPSFKGVLKSGKRFATEKKVRFEMKIEVEFIIECIWEWKENLQIFPPSLIQSKASSARNIFCTVCSKW